jgi:hypothetical protein
MARRSCKTKKPTPLSLTDAPQTVGRELPNASSCGSNTGPIASSRARPKVNSLEDQAAI